MGCNIPLEQQESGERQQLELQLGQPPAAQHLRSVLVPLEARRHQGCV